MTQATFPRRRDGAYEFRTRLARGLALPRGFALASFVVALSGCALAPPAARLADAAPPAWSAPVPHAGSRAELVDWWRRFDDPLLASLIDAAQANNPTLEQAAQRIVEARAQARAAGAAGWPTLDARAGSTRGNTLLIAAGNPATATRHDATLDAAWEIDLFGAARNQADAARARARGAEAQWHDARVSLAAEVADAYVGLRSCEAQLEIDEAQAKSLERTDALTRQKVEAGFEAPANGALARASAAEARARALAQRAECDVAVQRLAMLTTRPEASLREALPSRRARLPAPEALFEVPSVPAHVLAQRPDLAAAQREVVAAAADVGVAEADRYPRLRLTGSIGRSALRIGGDTLRASTWSIGPSLLAPIFDAGRRVAAVDAARARLAAAQALWHERALAAVREVEEALVRLDAAQQRLDDARLAVQGYETFLAAANTQWEVGAGSLLDLEQARRNAQGARAALVQTQREQVVGWLALYKAIGGGWQADERAPAASAAHDVRGVSPRASREGPR